MSYPLTTNDYKSILQYYNHSIPKLKSDLKMRAEEILAKKLCSCIKKVGGPSNESKSIGICTRTIFNRKGLKRGTFSCKKRKRHVTFSRNYARKTQKQRIQ